MIKIFYDILNGSKKYYVAEEVEYERGLRKLTRLSGQYKFESEAEAALKKILKDRESKNND